MFGYNANWWSNYNKKKKDEKKEYVPPNKCIVCSCEIKDGDWFNAGYDKHKIWLETCDKIRCKQWIEWKVRKKKGRK